jgi:hypothetical protein
MVQYQATHIPQLEIVCDTKREGAWRNWMNVLERAGGDGYLHIEDDATLTVDFLAKAEYEIGDGSIPVQFFSLNEGETGPAASRTFVMTQAVWVPPGHAALLLRYGPRWQVHGRKHWFNGGKHHYDLAMGDFWHEHGLRYWLVMPSLVQHMPRGSMLGHPGGRLSPTFRDPELRAHPYPELFEEST